MVHIFQHNGKNSAPGGLIEGIADYVRLSGGYPAKHWRRRFEGGPLNGYESTAFFLCFIEDGQPGFVRNLNLKLSEGRYYAELFEEVTGKTLEKLWEMYKEIHDVVN
ncbi:hypothetical protein BKA69DRAFT_1065311 [Paraphysoderma sedebokerense]|nr:hypothetical protein BKA69DRAFT_1065311 [Paraphysoderma sedebokerense]